MAHLPFNQLLMVLAGGLLEFRMQPLEALCLMQELKLHLTAFLVFQMMVLGSVGLAVFAIRLLVCVIATDRT